MPHPPSTRCSNLLTQPPSSPAVHGQCAVVARRHRGGVSRHRGCHPAPQLFVLLHPSEPHGQGVATSCSFRCTTGRHTSLGLLSGLLTVVASGAPHQASSWATGCCAQPRPACILPLPQTRYIRSSCQAKACLHSPLPPDALHPVLTRDQAARLAGTVPHLWSLWRDAGGEPHRPVGNLLQTHCMQVAML